MKIDTNAFVSIEYLLTLGSGEHIEESPLGEPLSFVFGAGQIVPGLEEGLRGKEVGFQGRIAVDASQGYGERSADLVKELPRAAFVDEDLHEGDVAQAPSEEGPVNFVIVKVTDDVVVADFNHPLAGQRLFFDVTVVDIQQSTKS